MQRLTEVREDAVAAKQSQKLLRILKPRWTTISTPPPRSPRSTTWSARSTPSWPQMACRGRNAVLDAIAKFDSVLGIFGPEDDQLLDADIEALIEERQQARRDRDFARSDEIRDDLADTESSSKTQRRRQVEAKIASPSGVSVRRIQWPWSGGCGRSSRRVRAPSKQHDREPIVSASRDIPIFREHLRASVLQYLHQILSKSDGQ